MTRPCDLNIQLTIVLTREMIRLADQGDADREDVGCGVLYGMLRDSAYKLRRMAEEEKRQHQAKGWWLGPDLNAVQSYKDAFAISDRKKEE